MNKYKKLGTNIVTFFIGNMGSRLVQFVFIPLYTYWLTTYEYGVIDTIVITVSLCCPFVSLSIHDALLRFLLEHDGKDKEYYSISILLGLVGSAAFSASVYVFNEIELLKPYWLYFYIYMILTVFYNIQNSLIRGLEYNKLYSVLGILLTLLQALGIYLLVGYLHQGIVGYMQALIVAYALSLCISVFATHSWRYFSLSAVSKRQFKSMLLYSIPLVPNAMMWWVINSSDKYLILYFLSPEANGLFAIASKIPLIINVIYTIFLMAWQISVVEEHNQEGKEKFYHTVYQYMVSGLFLFASFVMIFIKPLVLNFFDVGYIDTWRYVPILLISAVFTCLSGYYGSFYVAFKKTGGALKTSIVCGILNVCVNLIFINYIGLYGVSISNLLCFVFLYVYRIYDTRKMLIINNENLLVFLNALLLVCQSVAIYIPNIWWSSVVLTLLLGIMIIVNKNFLINMYHLVHLLINKYICGKNSI